MFTKIKALRSFLVIALTLPLLFTSCKRDAVNKDCDADCLQQILKEQWEPYAEKMKQENIGVALYVKTKDASYFSAYGFTQSFTTKSLFRGASTTKSFTAASVLKLYQEGKLNIDDPITGNIPGTSTPYLPNTPEYAIPHKEEITIRMLLNHRAGVFDITNDPIPDTSRVPYAGQRYTDYITELHGGHHDFTKPELLKPVVDLQLRYFAPNTAFHYSNTGYHLLGMIVENVSGMPLEAYKKKYLIDPLGLSSTYMAVNEAQSHIPQPKVDYYLRQGAAITKNDFENLSSAQADGNIITSIEDLANWSYQLWGTTNVLNAATLAEMIEMVPTQEVHEFYGLGCEGGPSDIGYGHNGARIGTMITMRYDPVSKATFTVVTNFLDANDFVGQGRVANEIIRAAQAKFR